MSFGAVTSTQYEVEFQGALVRLAMKDAPKVPKGITQFRAGRIYDDAFYELWSAAARKSFKSSELVYVSDKLVAAPFSSETLHQIEIDAGILARERARARHTRGAITEFSRRSRGRLLRLVARLKPEASGLFLTVTYRENMRDHALAKKHLDKLLRWLKYNYPAGAFLWRMEYQRRGAIHFHLLCFNVQFIEAGKVTAYWQNMTGDNSYPDVSEIQNRRKATYYVSKYIAKVADGMDAVPSWLLSLSVRSARLALALTALARHGFIYVPYLEKSGFVGRFWGVVNRKNLPYAPLRSCRIVGGADVLHEMRRYARRYSPKVSKRLQGFSLFVDDAERWRQLMEYHIGESWCVDHVKRSEAHINFRSNLTRTRNHICPVGADI